MTSRLALAMEITDITLQITCERRRIDRLDDMLSDSDGEDLDVAKIERSRKKAKANLEELTRKCNKLLLKQHRIAKKQVCMGVEKASKYLLNECV
jgi:hypothetical protein